MTLAEKDVQWVFVDGWSLLIILYIYSLYKNSVFALKISVLDLVNFIKYPINISLFFVKTHCWYCCSFPLYTSYHVVTVKM